MEKQLDRVMDDLLTQPKVLGCMFVDHQGLCLGSKGTASSENAGLLAALAEHAARLEPDSAPPIITLETDKKTCIVQRSGTITGVIYKHKN